MNRYWFLFLVFPYDGLFADDEEQLLEDVVVYGHRLKSIGSSISSSEGIIGSKEIEIRPISRVGEILEFVPGMIVTQHSGSGKANQYFLRGFNLDHGTDFSTSIDGMPVNMRSHGHGQGYTDLNFIVSELIESITYFKGPYHAETGDFSGAGSASFRLFDRLPASFADMGIGGDGYRRLVTGNNIPILSGNMVLGFEIHKYDGPWKDIDEDVDKFNGLARYSVSHKGSNFDLTFMAYENTWDSADQIPQRAVENGIIDRLGSVDKTVGGESQRHSVSANWSSEAWRFNGYFISSHLDLFSNFTYLLADMENGDQFEQVDKRNITGGTVQYNDHIHIAGQRWSYLTGIDLRYDDIDEVGLYNTDGRQRFATVRSDSVKEASIAYYMQTEAILTDSVALRLGARYDYFTADINSDTVQNSGEASDDIVSLKLGVRYAFSENIELYFNAGEGFHSNDARGTTIQIDPVSSAPTPSVDFLARSEGAEAGVRLFDEQLFNVSASLWYLNLDSELVFVGDAGNTEASRPSKRSGIEISSYLWIDEAWSFDAELAWTRSRFSESAAAEGDHVEGSVPFVGSIGVSYSPGNRWYGALRGRYFGARVLDGFDENKADSTMIFNLTTGYRFSSLDIGIDVLNILNSKDHDIDYFYESRLENEPIDGIADIHFHPVEPRTYRLSVRYQY